MKTYTIGQVARLGLLKNHKGKPYSQKQTVLKVLHANCALKRIHTPFGMGYAVTQAQIAKLNKRWR